MNQTTQQEQGAAAAKPRARRDWEWFWRVIAGLMLLVIAWVAWVLYQITPRSVVTPLAYSNQIRPIAQQPAAAATAPAAASSAPQPAAPAAAAVLAMGIAQAAARAGAHQSSADVQAAAMEKKEEQIKGEGLRLATEISMPPAEKAGIPKKAEGKAGGGVPAATGAAGKNQP